MMTAMEKTEKDRERRVNPLKSIITRIMLLGTAVILITVILNVWTIVPLAQKYFGELTQNYMCDMAVAYGEMLDNIIAENPDEEVQRQKIKQAAQEIVINDMDSGYAYVVSGDGTMLYHPTADKIGKPVENVVVTGLVEQLKKGVIPQTQAEEYLFNGVVKYAAYYVAGGGQMILVVTADQEEAFLPVETIIVKSIEGGIFSFVVCLAIMLAISLLIVMPIKRITKVILNIADLDFTEQEVQKRLNRRGDETGAMSRASTALQRKLREVVAEIQTQSRELHGAAGQLDRHASDTAESVSQVDKAVQEIADGATEQAQETQKATEDVVLIGDMVQKSTEELDKLRDEARAMRSAGEEASVKMSALDEINKQAIESIEVIYRQTHTTNESALKIREATNLITSIAEETNLLSLNATIEAARAGEQGRGFAVVAGQIQKLAEQSNNSAQQIELIINSLIHDSEETVQTMNSVKTVMEQQSENVEQTSRLFGNVSEGIGRTIDGIRMLAAQIEQMGGARDSVVEAVQSLTAIAEENAASTEETSASVTEVGDIVLQIANNAESLKKIADELEQNMKAFQV